MNEFKPFIAHIKAEDGSVFQVLNEDGTDWDEVATQLMYEDYQKDKQQGT